MTHARHFPAAWMHVQPAAVVLDDGRFVVAASCGPSPIAATVVGFSIATTASPSAGIPRCSSASSDALAENSFRISSINTLGFVAAALLVSVGCCLGVDFSGDLIDLDWGSWEGSLPESSSLGGDGRPLRGAFFIDPTSSIRGFKNSLQEKLYQLCGAGDILIAIDSRRLGPSWSAKMAHSFTAADRQHSLPATFLTISSGQQPRWTRPSSRRRRSELQSVNIPDCVFAWLTSASVLDNAKPLPNVTC